MLFTIFLLLSVSYAGQLQIHFFDVGQGDSQLIVFPSGYTILVDAGEKSSSSMNCKTIASRIKAITGKSHIDVGVLSHIHADHFGYPFKSGLWYLLESAGITFGKFISRNAGKVKSGVTDCESATESDITWSNMGSVASRAPQWVCYTTNTATSSQMASVYEDAVQCGSQIKPSDSGASVEIVVVNAAGISASGKALSGDHRSDSTPPSENDYSVCLRIQYGDFVFSTCGDLDGENSGAYHDIESYYAKVMGSVDVYKSNHHGSSHSNNANWLAKLQPTVSVIQCGAGNSYGHPTKAAMTNMNKYSSKIYLTEDCNSGVTDGFSSSYIANGEIIVKYTKGSSTFTVTSASASFTHTYNVKTNKGSRTACSKQSN